MNPRTAIAAVSVMLMACAAPVLPSATPAPAVPSTTASAAHTAIPQTEATASATAAVLVMPKVAQPDPTSTTPPSSATPKQTSEPPTATPIPATPTPVPPAATKVPTTPTRLPASAAPAQPTRLPPTRAAVIPTAVPPPPIAAPIASGLGPALQRAFKAQVTPVEAFPISKRLTTLLGSQNAPVYMVEYGDFLCDQCWYFKTQAWPQIYRNYIATGKVVMIYKHWQVRGNSSLFVSATAECAAEQGKFWPYHDLLFRNFSLATGSFTEDKLQAYAQQSGVDMARWNDCVTSNRMVPVVRADWAEAQRLSIGVPIFIINDEMIYGNQPYGVFQEVIERKLRGGE